MAWKGLYGYRGTHLNTLRTRYGLVCKIGAEPTDVSLDYAHRSGNREGASAAQRGCLKPSRLERSLHRDTKEGGRSLSHLSRHFSGEKTLKLPNRCRPEFTYFHHTRACQRSRSLSLTANTFPAVALSNLCNIRTDQGTVNWDVQDCKREVRNTEHRAIRHPP